MPPITRKGTLKNQKTRILFPVSGGRVICGKNGKPLTKESFGNAFKDACKAAGLHNRSAHGGRKIAATRAAEAGATVAAIPGRGLLSFILQALRYGPRRPLRVHFFHNEQQLQILA